MGKVAVTTSIESELKAGAIEKGIKYSEALALGLTIMLGVKDLPLKYVDQREREVRELRDNIMKQAAAILKLNSHIQRNNEIIRSLRSGDVK